MEDNDVQLQIKKRARRRLVGAVFFVSVVAVVLPMVMDNEPRQVVQDVEIRIPGQDEKPFAPKFAGAAPDKAVEAPAREVEAPVPAPVPEPAPVAEPVAAVPLAKPTARVVEVTKDNEKSPEKVVEKAPEKAPAKPEKAAEKPAAKPDKPAAKPEKSEKPADKNAEKTAAKADEAKRAAAILAGGQSAEAKPAAKGGEHLILIGAFANEANVKTLKTKLAEQGIKTFSEPLDTPQGKKTRVRAGPFPSREAAEKALEKMQRIGVSGVVAAKQ